jgi:thiamine biosynthesis lipoprotein
MRRARPLLGTIVQITVEGAAEVLESKVDAAFAAIERVHQLMSFHDATSDVARLNAAPAGCSVRVDTQTYRVIAFALELSELSGGAFDITTASELVSQGFLPNSDPGMAATHSTFRDLELLPYDCVRWHEKGRIDLGGIAKGYAVDCAIEALRSEGITTAVVNAGGDLRCFGESQPIHLRHPETPTTLIHLGRLADAAFATSAGYFSEIETDEHRIDPIVDPKRRACVSWNGSVSVAAANCMVADALTKIVRLDPQIAPRVLEQFGAQAFVVDAQGIRCCGRSWFQKDVQDGEYATASHALESNA